MSSDKPPEVTDAGDVIDDDADARQELVDGLRTLAKNANSALNGLADAAALTPRVEKNPYGMVAAALGVGYVVGGGLFTPTTARLLRMGMKLAAVPMVRDRLLDVAETAIDGLLAQHAAGPADPTKKD